MIDTVAAEEVVSLSAQDRCDRCGAQAYTIASRADVPSDLLFCKHHTRDVEPALLEQGWTVVESTLIDEV